MTDKYSEDLLSLLVQVEKLQVALRHVTADRDALRAELRESRAAQQECLQALLVAREQLIQFQAHLCIVRDNNQQLVEDNLRLQQRVKQLQQQHQQHQLSHITHGMFDCGTLTLSNSSAADSSRSSSAMSSSSMNSETGLQQQQQPWMQQLQEQLERLHKLQYQMHDRQPVQQHAAKHAKLDAHMKEVPTAGSTPSSMHQSSTLLVNGRMQEQTRLPVLCIEQQQPVHIQAFNGVSQEQQRYAECAAPVLDQQQQQLQLQQPGVHNPNAGNTACTTHQQQSGEDSLVVHTATHLLQSQQQAAAVATAAATDAGPAAEGTVRLTAQDLDFALEEIQHLQQRLAATAAKLDSISAGQDQLKHVQQTQQYNGTTDQTQQQPMHSVRQLPQQMLQQCVQLKQQCKVDQQSHIVLSQANLSNVASVASPIQNGLHTVMIDKSCAYSSMDAVQPMQQRQHLQEMSQRQQQQLTSSVGSNSRRQRPPWNYHRQPQLQLPQKRNAVRLRRPQPELQQQQQRLQKEQQQLDAAQLQLLSSIEVAEALRSSAEYGSQLSTSYSKLVTDTCRADVLAVHCADASAPDGVVAATLVDGCGAGSHDPNHIHVSEPTGTVSQPSTACTPPTAVAVTDGETVCTGSLGLSSNHDSNLGQIKCNAFDSSATEGSMRLATHVKYMQPARLKGPRLLPTAAW